MSVAIRPILLFFGTLNSDPWNLLPSHFCFMNTIVFENDNNLHTIQSPQGDIWEMEIQSPPE